MALPVKNREPGARPQPKTAPFIIAAAQSVASGVEARSRTRSGRVVLVGGATSFVVLFTGAADCGNPHPIDAGKDNTSGPAPTSQTTAPSSRPTSSQPSSQPTGSTQQVDDLDHPTHVPGIPDKALGAYVKAADKYGEGIVKWYDLAGIGRELSNHGRLDEP